MDVCPSALYTALKCDLSRGLCDTEADLLASDCSLVRKADAHILARKALLNSFLKKFGDVPPKEAARADRRALDLFLQWNTRCSEWAPPVVDHKTELGIAIGELRATFLQCFEQPYGEVIDFAGFSAMYYRHGPGASVGVALTDFYTKHCAGPMTTDSEHLYWEYYSSVLPFQLEQETENCRSTNFSTTVVRGSLLGFAPKNREISRTRATEPSLNMYYQLGTGVVLEDVLRDRFNIDLSTQPLYNNALSRLGSISGRFGTTDMSSASDGTSLGLWNWLMLYPEIRDWFLRIRSKETQTPGGEWVELHMLSSMGNGFTFPLMTLIFTCVVVAVYKTLGIQLRYNSVGKDGELIPGNFGVFGDDIIVETRAFKLVNECLEALGYAVNADKSFGAGPFRESCGTDWFLGLDVRGVYCKTLKRPQDRYNLINQLNAWSSEWHIALPQTLKPLLASVWKLYIPPWENSEAGIIVPVDIAKPRGRDEYGGYVYNAYRSRPTRWQPARGLTERHYNRRGDLATPREGPRFVNDWGILLSYVRGYIKEGWSNCRDDNAQFQKTRLTTPGWAFTGRSTCGFSKSGWAVFESCMAQLNLGI